MHIVRARSIPHVLKRVYSAFLANDPIGMAEAYAVDARLATQYDSQIAASFGFTEETAPILARHAVGILRLHAYELSMIEVDEAEIVSVAENDGRLDTVSRWNIKLQATGTKHEGYCNQSWLLDRSGRKLVEGQSYCGLLPTGATLVKI